MEIVPYAIGRREGTLEMWYISYILVVLAKMECTYLLGERIIFGSALNFSNDEVHSHLCFKASSSHL